MDRLVETLRRQLPALFESDAYETAQGEAVKDLREKQAEKVQHFQERVQNEGFVVIQVQMGPLTRPEILPVLDGKPIPMPQLPLLVRDGKLSEERARALDAKHTELLEELASISSDVKSIEREVQERLQESDKKLVKEALADTFQEVRAAFKAKPVQVFIDAVERDLLEHLGRFKGDGEEKAEAGDQESGLGRYRVNVVVDNGRRKGPPVIVESHPSYRNLFGAIEWRSDGEGHGTPDYRDVRAGSLMRADRGYLILNALDVLPEPGVWQALKRTLRTGRLVIPGADPSSPFWSTSLRPEPVAIRTKVVMIGDANLYALLYELDEDFRKIFKVKAEFDAVMPRAAGSVAQYARFVARVCKSESLPRFDRSAVAQIVEYGVRLAGHNEKLSTHFTYIKDLIVEAAYCAKQVGSERVEGVHVDQALRAQIERSNLLERKIQEAIARDEILVDTSGAKVGQVNGLAFLTLGPRAFGKPQRITAEIGVGRAGIINVEREVELSGSTHDKGVLILSGFLRGRFARKTPLALSASLCFEQSYAGIDGDSASSAEACALLSALAGVPIRQDLAVTGSVNQKGELQPIGGVNEKIEGFFDVCRARGLTGTQGVVIPSRNVPHLMLREDVIDAVREGDFRVIAVNTVDEAMEVLTGIPAGERGADETFPPGTVNGRVELRLLDLAGRVRAFGAEIAPGA
jgi:lon-related putative ATP-dependent protease